MQINFAPNFTTTCSPNRQLFVAEVDIHVYANFMGPAYTRFLSFSPLFSNYKLDGSMLVVFVPGIEFMNLRVL
jgi:hypothetical protein